MSNAMVIHDDEGGNGTVVAAQSVQLGTLRYSSPVQMVQGATAVANALKSVITTQRLAVRISGREYVRVEGWTTLSTMMGVLPREVDVERAEDGTYTAVVELVRMSDGAVLCRASAECGSDEPTWKARPNYARRSMAITRATGKAARLAFSWVMVLAGYEGCPLEEVESIIQHAPAPPPPRPAPVVEATVVPPGDPSHPPGAVGSDVPDMEIWFGRDKGNRVSTLNWNALKNLNDWATKTWEKPTGRQSELLACVAYHLAEKAAQSNLKPTPADADGEEIPF